MAGESLGSEVAKDRVELAGGRENAKSGQDGKCASGDGLQMGGHFTNAWPCGPVPILIYASLCDHCNYVLKATGPQWPCMATYGPVHQAGRRPPGGQTTASAPSRSREFSGTGTGAL